MNVFEKSYILVAFYDKFATFSGFEKTNWFFFEKPIYFFFKKPNFWTFWEILLFQSDFTASLLPLAILKKFIIFFRESHLFYWKKAQFLIVLRKFTISVAFYGKFATFSDFERIQSFFEKPINFFIKPNLWTFWEILLFQSHFLANLLPLAILEKFQYFFSKKPSILLKKAQFLNV